MSFHPHWSRDKCYTTETNPYKDLQFDWPHQRSWQPADVPLSTQPVRSDRLCLHYENYLFYCFPRDVAFHGNSDWAVNPPMMGGRVQQTGPGEGSWRWWGLQLENWKTTRGGCCCCCPPQPPHSQGIQEKKTVTVSESERGSLQFEPYKHCLGGRAAPEREITWLADLNLSG